MIYSITDIGSNTVKMNIFDTSLPKKNIFTPIFSESITLKLASMRKNGYLSEEGTELLCDVLLKYKQDAEKYGSDVFCAFATASIRNISNTDDVIRAVYQKTGISVDLLSGDDEARLSFDGMKTEYPYAERGLMTDMGGGSTELISFDSSSPIESFSMPIGCVMLKSEFVQSGIFPSITEQDAIADKISGMLDLGSPSGTYSDIYLVGGTARALFRLALTANTVQTGATHTSETGVSDVITFRGRAFPHRYGYKSNSDARRSIGMDVFSDVYESYRSGCCDPVIAAMIRSAVPERIDTVIPGMTALGCICNRYGIKTLHLVTSGVREGYLTRLLSENPYKR